MTILAIPATSVPSERVFSSCAQTDTQYRNRLSPVLLEMLQVLKFNHRSGIMDFTLEFLDDVNELEAITYDELTNDDLTYNS
jgi:hypothetical protein